MENAAAEDVLDAIEASVAAVRVRVRGNRSEGEPGADMLLLRADDWLEILTESASIQAKTAALTAHAAAGFAVARQALAAPDASPQDRKAQEMSLVAEVACALTVSEQAAGTLLGEAHTLTASLPLTMAALEAGTVSWQHARIMVDETTNLDPAGARALEAHFLDPEVIDPARGPIGDMIPSRFRHKARVWRERHHPVSIEVRHTRSLADRRLECSPDRDGMAWLSAYLPADTAFGIWNRATAAARALQGPKESRTLSQLRADTAADWLLSSGLTYPTATPGTPGTVRAGTAHPGSLGVGSAGAGSAGVVGPAGAHDPATLGAAVVVGGPTSPGAAPGLGGAPGVAGEAGIAGEQGPGVSSPRAQVLVTVPVFSLMGLTDEPAMLDGYGPIPPSMARQLIADGADSFHRVLIDPRDGAPLEIGRTSYRVTKTQRQWLRMRDGKCPFPGCGNQSLDNEADHILAWAHGGTTGISNLGSPCPRHHRLRHTSGWTPTPATQDQPPGWISPTGRHYASEHPDWEPPHWPDEGLEREFTVAPWQQGDPEPLHPLHPLGQMDEPDQPDQQEYPNEPDLSEHPEDPECPGQPALA